MSVIRYVQAPVEDDAELKIRSALPCTVPRCSGNLKRWAFHFHRPDGFLEGLIFVRDIILKIVWATMRQFCSIFDELYLAVKSDPMKTTSV